MSDDGQLGRRSPEHDEVEAMMAGFDQCSHVLLALRGPELRLAAFNQPGADLVGNRTLGLPLREAFADLAGQGIYEPYERCFATGEPQSLGVWRIQFDAPGGGRGEAYVDFTVTPWKDTAGEVLGVVGEGRDVSEQVRATQAAEARQSLAEQTWADVQLLVRTMQDELLPRALPMLPHLDLGARYLQAAEDDASGGDWFDAVVRPDGLVALVVGDVVGHGASASATMGQLRAVAYERLTSTAPLPQVLADLDRYARGVPEARHATVCVVELDPPTGAGRYCTAGHPPPLVVTSGRSSFLPPTGAGPLATTGDLAIGTFTLPSVNDLVVLYSDGLLERPETTPAASTVELAATVGDAAAGRGLALGAPVRATERVCQLTLEMMTRTTGHSDDVTILAAERTAPPKPLRLTVPAQAVSLAVVRDRLGRWLDRIDVRTLDRIALTHAVSELLANAAEHAYAHQTLAGEMTLELELTDTGVIAVAVTDEGRWRPPSEATTDHQLPGGRGLHMARAFLDGLAVHGTDHGTTATGALRPSRPASLMTAGTVAPPPRHEQSFEVIERDDALVVRGALLGGAADELDRALRRRTAAGVVAAVVDLTDVTHLGSAAVRVLHDVITTDGTDVTLVAPYGTTAQHILDLVRLPHRAGPDGGPASF